MKAFVLDASVALAFAIPDEESAETRGLLRLFQTSTVHVPALWPTELANGLLVAERKGRITPTEIERFARTLDSLSIVIDAASLDQSHTTEIARQGSLTVYDASYLSLAITAKLPLATFDSALRRAATQLGVELV